MPHASIRSSASSAPIAGRGNSRASSVLGLVSTTARTVSLPAIGRHLHQGAEAAVERRRAAGHQAGLQHLEDLLAGGTEADRALHVGDEAGAVGAAEGQERDGDELADLGGDVLALAQPELVDAVVRLDELRVLPRGELPLRIDVAARRLHLGDQRVRALRRAVLGHRLPPFQSGQEPRRRLVDLGQLVSAREPQRDVAGAGAGPAPGPLDAAPPPPRGTGPAAPAYLVPLPLTA